MKVAITSTGNSPDSMLDPRFGRCSWFVIYDTETGSTEFIPNPYKNEEEDVGLAVVNLIISRQVKEIISGEFGVKVKSLLDRRQVQLILLKESGFTITKIIELLNH